MKPGDIIEYRTSKNPRKEKRGEVTGVRAALWGTEIDLHGHPDYKVRPWTIRLEFVTEMRVVGRAR